MNCKAKPELRERLAAEYALGTLRGRARQRLRRWMREDAALAAAVEQWQQEGVPRSPRAWLVSAGRFKAIDAMRRRARLDASLDELAKRIEAQQDAAVPDREGTVASLWVPHAAFAERGDIVDPGVERVSAPVTWAALDCVGGWAEALDGRPMVLGRITARVDALPVVGEPHVAVGNLRGVDGRKSFTASTLYDADGRVVATAEHTWIAVDPSIFN